MSECLTCLNWNQRNHIRSGKCAETGSAKDAMDGCKLHVLAPMAMVRPRSKREITFDASGKAVLK